MNVNGVKSSSTNFTSGLSVLKRAQKWNAEKFSKIEQLGESMNIALDFSGKAVLVPATIMLTSKEDEEKKQYSAFKNPIAATIQLLMEVPILFFGSKLIEKLGNQGKLDPKDGSTSYNASKAKEALIETIKNTFENEEPMRKANAHKHIEKLETKQLTRVLKEDVVEFFENSKGKDKEVLKTLKDAMENYDVTNKKLFHLSNRLCFATAIILTPLLCLVEDYTFPKIMNMIKKKPADDKNNQASNAQQVKIQMPSMKEYKDFFNKGGNV